VRRSGAWAWNPDGGGCMQTRGRADQVYQLTLTELAFIVIFLILLLAGWMSVKTEREKEAAVRQREEALSRLAELAKDNGAAARLEHLHESLRRAEQDIRQLLAGQGIAHPDDIVSELVKKGRAEAENWRLQQRIEDLDAQLSALEEIRKENRDLRAQAAWMRNQLDARGGRDYPPCWVEENTGKPQYLFTIEIRDGGLRIDPAWPPERNGDARQLPGMDGLAGAGPLTIPVFRARVQALDEDSKTKNCRHYVRLVNRVGSLAAFNRQRYAVEEFFYKFEIR
jgi:hypothetical protein